MSPLAPLWAVSLLLALPTVAAGTSPSTPTDLHQVVQHLGLAPETTLAPIVLPTEAVEWVRGTIPRTDVGSSLTRLLDEMTAPRGLAIQYREGYTATASEVFERREGNCLSFTQLFVSLARELELPVYFVHYRDVTRFAKRGDLVIVNEHVSAAYSDGPTQILLDFGVIPEAQRYRVSKISDLTALAIYYSNRGAELLLEDRLEEADRMLRLAVELDPGWADSWANLGVVRRRSGNPEGAEQAYRLAIKAEPNHLTGYQNLSALLWSRGEARAAREILRLLEDQGTRNPYVYLALGDLIMRSGQPRQARRLYKRARRLAPELAEVHAAYGAWALAAGKTNAAVKALREARSLDPEDPRTVELGLELAESSKAGALLDERSDAES